MNMKKLLAVLCACALVFALAIPAFAEATPGELYPNGTKVDFEGTMPDEDITVSVSVLTALTKLYVNPYGLPYKIADGKIGNAPTGEQEDTRDTIKEGTVTDGWFSNTAAIKNDSDANLSVKVTLTTTTKGNVKVVTTDPTGTSPAENTLYGNFQIAAAKYASKTITPGTFKADYNVVIPEGSGTPGVAGTPYEQDTTFILNKAGTDVEQGQTISVPTYAAFRLRGVAVIGSGSGDASDSNASGWDKADLADVSVAFSFAPSTSENADYNS